MKTTAPALALLGPDGQALPTPTAPLTDWKPVQRTTNGTVWEKPRALPTIDLVGQAQASADAILTDAQAKADRITNDARAHRERILADADSDADRIREQAATAVQEKNARGKRIDVWMGRAAIAAAVGLTATGEYALARLAHFPAQVAWLLPFVIDVYVIQAFRRHRDILQAITLTIAANVVYHLAAAGMFGVTSAGKGEYRATWWLIAMVASIASVILWRMHVITAPPKRHTAAAAPGPVPAEPPVLRTPDRPVQPAVEPGTGTAPGTGGEHQEHTRVPDAGTGPSTAPEPTPVPAPVPPRVPTVKQRGTGSKKRPGTGRRSPAGTGPKNAPSTASFDEHVATARKWLKTEPDLSGTDIGKRLGTGDSYGRRVKRAATA